VATISKYITENTNINDKIKQKEIIILDFVAFLDYKLISDFSKPDYIFFDTLETPNFSPNDFELPKPTVTAIIPDMISSNTETTVPDDFELFLEKKNTLTTNLNKFELRLGTITSEKRIEVTLSSTYNFDININNITYDYNIGVEVDINNGTTLPTNSALTFIFKLRTDKGKKIVEDNVYFHLSNGLIVPFKLCFIRALKNTYFLPPDKHTYSENYYYFSKNFVSLAGREDVVPFLDNPKKSFSATYSYRDPNKADAMYNIALSNEVSMAYFPIWSEVMYVTNTAVNPAYLIYVNEIRKYVEQNAPILLINQDNYFDFLVITVGGVDNKNNMITLIEPVTYTDRYFVVPLAQVVPNSNPSKQYYNIKDNKLTINVRTLK